MNCTAVKPGVFWRRPKQTPKEIREGLAKGRQKNRWREEAIYMYELKKLKLRKWSQPVKERKAWKDLVQKTKARVRGVVVSEKERIF